LDTLWLRKQMGVRESLRLDKDAASRRAANPEAKEFLVRMPDAAKFYMDG
jgi:hypothetical protein